MPYDEQNFRRYQQQQNQTTTRWAIAMLVILGILAVLGPAILR